MSTLVFASVQTYGEIFTLSNPGDAASVHARQDIPLVYTRIDGVAAPAGETIAALTYAATLTSGATFDQTLSDWAIVTHTGTGALLVVPLQTVIALPALIASGTYAILAWITRDRIYPWPQIAIPSMKTEGGMWRNRSIGDPTDPDTPPVPTEMPVGDVGQLIQVVPDANGYMSPFDPNQATNHTADPAYTALALTNGMIPAWRYDANGNPLLSEVPVGTDGQVLAAKSNPSAHDNTGATVASDEPIYQNIAWVLKHLLDTKGSLVKGGAGTPAGDSVKLPLGTQYQVLTSDGTDALWKDLAYSLVQYLQSILPAKGDMLTMDASDLPRRVDTGIGTAAQILAVVSGLPSWQNIAWVLAQFLQANAGELVQGVGGGSNATTLIPGADKTILRSHGTGAALTWETVSDALKAVIPTAGQMIKNAGGTPVAMDPATTKGVLTSDSGIASGTPFWLETSGTDPGVLVENSGAIAWKYATTSSILAVNSGLLQWVDNAGIDGILVIQGGAVSFLSRPSGATVLVYTGSGFDWATPPSVPSVLVFSGGTVQWLPTTSSSQEFFKGSTSGFTWVP